MKNHMQVIQEQAESHQDSKKSSSEMNPCSPISGKLSGKIRPVNVEQPAVVREEISSSLDHSKKTFAEDNDMMF